MLCNYKLHKSTQFVGLAIYIEYQKREWLKKVYKWKPMLRRPLGRPKNGWEDDLAIYIEYHKREWLKRYINGN